MDLVRRGGFFLHGLVEKRARGRGELLCEKRLQEGERALVEVGVGWGMDRCEYMWLNFSAETTRTQVVLADRPRGRSGKSEEESHLNILVLYINFSLYSILQN